MNAPLNIIVLEDQSYTQAAYRNAAVGHTLHWCSTVDEFSNVLERNIVPDIAFIDFGLDTAGLGGSGLSREDTGTGLGALVALRKRFGDNPGQKPKVIVSTSLSDHGRKLFALAAMQWFGAWGIAEKGRLKEVDIANAINGTNPTHPNLRSDFRDYGYLLDDLFADRQWAQIWQVWADSNGLDKLAYAHLDGAVSEYAIKKFRINMPERVNNLHYAFFRHSNWAELNLAQKANDGTHSKVKDVLKGLISAKERTASKASYARQDYRPLLGLAHEQSQFFTAPELCEAVELAQPWDRANPPHKPI